MQLICVILAAGQGTRMKSRLPKILHPLAGKPLVMHILETAAQLSQELPVLVVSATDEQVQHVVGTAARFVVQDQPLGTADAVRAAETAAGGKADLVLVTFADMPLLKVETLKRLVQTQAENDGPMTLLTVELDDAHGFGRVVRSPDGAVRVVVEEAEADFQTRSLRELSAGACCFRASWLWNALRRVKFSSEGEYYLTGLVEVAVNEGQTVRALKTDDPSEAVGINTRVHLAEAEGVLRQRTNTHWMLEGVTIVDPATTFIEPGVELGMDTVVWPNTYLRGSTVVGESCSIGPDTILENSWVGSNCRILASYLESATLEEDVRMGPFCHLRPGAYLARGVKMGNFGEVKGSYLGPGVHMGHFSYIGDATIGEHTNIGAGTITCNFDGQNKFKTEIGENAFIGSDTMLVAPLKIGDRARTGAGAVVTHDVPNDGLVVGVPARPFTAKLEKSD